MVDGKKSPFFLRVVKKKTDLLILMKKSLNPVETKKEN